VPAIDPDKLATIRFSDIFENGAMKSLFDINENYNLGFNLLTYMRLGTAITNFFRNLKPNRVTDSTSLGVEKFLLRFKQGSRPIRNILGLSNNKNNFIINQGFVKTFYRLSGIRPICPEKTKLFLEFWDNSSLPNRLREFILKFNFNLLGINTRVAHFAENVGRSCTFCRIKNSGAISDESFIHLFFECSTTNLWLRYFEREFFPEILFPDILSRKEFWFCQYNLEHSIHKNMFVKATIWSIKLSIWGAKLAKKTPSNRTLCMDVVNTLNGIYENSQKARFEKNYNNFYICRSWDAVRGRW